MWVLKEWYDGNQKEVEISFSAYDEDLNEIYMHRNCFGEIKVHHNDEVIGTFESVSDAKKYIVDFVKELNEK